MNEKYQIELYENLFVPYIAICINYLFIILFHIVTILQYSYFLLSYRRKLKSYPNYHILQKKIFEEAKIRVDDVGVLQCGNIRTRKSRVVIEKGFWNFKLKYKQL